MTETRLPPVVTSGPSQPGPTRQGEFDWRQFDGAFTKDDSGNVNIVYDALDKWASDEKKRSSNALIIEGHGTSKGFSYLELRELSSQWANLFTQSGLVQGDRLLIYLPACFEVYVSALACARLGIIFAPLYSNLNVEEIAERILCIKPRAVVTHPRLADHLPKKAMRSVEKVFFVESPLPGQFSGEVSVRDVLQSLPKKTQTKWFGWTSPLYIMFTSGATGPIKAVVHCHRDAVGLRVTAETVLGLNENSILWTDANPGWITGIAYGLFAPLLCGATSLVQTDKFLASSWYRTLERHRVSVLYTTPRTLRRLQISGDDLPGRYDLSSLKHIASLGEHLDPSLISWTREHLGLTPHDTWWMTETGMINIANTVSMTVKPGSMGTAVPGIEASVLDDDGNPLQTGISGELALKADWPAIMTGLWMDAPRYQEYFRTKGWFRTGDIVTRDYDGYFYHQGRKDDLVKHGNGNIGPYEIERILQLHPGVESAAAISVGKLSGKRLLKAFVSLNDGFSSSNTLKHELKTFLKGSFSSEIPLADIEVLDELPKTRSGRIARRVLRAKELGMPCGNISELLDE
jgi:acetyl-CoA synthetase